MSSGTFSSLSMLLGKWPKNSPRLAKFLNWFKPPKSGERTKEMSIPPLKEMSIPPFWVDVGMKKWSQFFLATLVALHFPTVSESLG